MKNKALLLLLCILLSVAGTLSAEENEADKAAIDRAARNYFEGFFEGNKEKLVAALSPELAKRVVMTLPNGRDVLRAAPYLMMIEYGGGGFAKKEIDAEEIKVEIYDINENIASARITDNQQYYDYLHLAKMNGEWKIVNVLWKPVKAK